MALGDFLARLGGREEPREDALEPAPAPPTRADLLVALDATESLVDGGAVPSPVTARVLRVTAAVRDTLPRLDALGAGSAQAYSVVATATDYLPEAVDGYLRLPRRFADSRPVDAGKTSLMVLVDQLDLLGATMDRVFDAVCRDDANALVAHGRFLAEKFGHGSGGGALELRPGETALPEQPPLDPPPPDRPRDEDPPPPERADVAAAGSRPDSGSPGATATPADADRPVGPAGPDKPTRLEPPRLEAPGGGS